MENFNMENIAPAILKKLEILEIYLQELKSRNEKSKIRASDIMSKPWVDVDEFTFITNIKKAQVYQPFSSADHLLSVHL